MLEDEKLADVDTICIAPPDNDDSDGYDDSETEDANPARLSRAVLQAKVLEVQSKGVEPVLDELDTLPDDGGEEEDLQQSASSPKRIRATRSDAEWKWEDQTTSFNSRQPPLFPEGIYSTWP